MTQFHKTLMDGIRQQMEWSRARKEDVGYGLLGVCPTCGTPDGFMLAGWMNPEAGTGKAQFRCRTCGKSWTWARKPKVIR